MSDRWYTEEIGPDILLIKNGGVVIGSIALVGGTWSAEILWTGPNGDIKSEFSGYLQALAFVQGVEHAMMALGFDDPRMAPMVHGPERY